MADPATIPNGTLVEERCSGCGAPDGYINMDWAAARTGTNPETAAIAEHIEYVRELKFGQLHRCRVCGEWWYLNDARSTIERVRPERRAIVRAWDGCRTAPSPEVFAALDRIGATEADQYGNGRGELKVPCRIAWAGESTDDPCVFVITKRPPIDDWFARCKLFRPDARVLPSKFALPAEVRLQTLRAEEIRMLYAPTVVVADSGQRLIINWSANVLHHSDVVGSRVRLATDADAKYDPSLPIVSEPFDETTYVFCDWFDGCRALLLA